MENTARADGLILTQRDNSTMGNAPLRQEEKALVRKKRRVPKNRAVHEATYYLLISPRAW
jgi:hypothetical protein